MNKREMFMINEKARDQDLVNSPFKIVTDHFDYLGICVTKQFNPLFKKNLLPILDGAYCLCL